jgi:hypothetical protein
MMNQKIETLFAFVAPAAFHAFGDNAQMIKTIEELSELTQVLCKKINGAPVTDEQIIDEIADVIVMANQMRFKFGPEAVDERILFKLNRTAKYIVAMNNALQGKKS